MNLFSCWAPFASVLVGAVALRSAPLSTGKGVIECANGAEPIAVFTYKPPHYHDGPIFVVFHGAERDAEDSRDSMIPAADKFGAIVVAPLFDKERFPTWRYQFGGILDKQGKAQAPESWTFAVVPKIVAHVRSLERAPTLPYYLIGHSAGGQFLVRLAALLPGDATRIIAVNPGSELFPTREQDFPFGFGKLPPGLSNDDDLRTYLAVPLVLYLGTNDTYPKPSFDDSPPAMKQGNSRLARGRNCLLFAASLARKRGWMLKWRKVEAPNIGHKAAAMFDAAEMADALFGH